MPRDRDDESRRQILGLRRDMGYDQQERAEEESRSVRVRIGQALNVRVRLKHAVTAVSVASVLAIVGAARGDVPVPAFVTRAWVDEVNKHVERGEASRAEVMKRLDEHDQVLRELGDEVWALRCDMTDEWRWRAVQDGQSERARYLAQRLHEMGLRAGRQCP